MRFHALLLAAAALATPLAAQAPDTVGAAPAGHVVRWYEAAGAAGAAALLMAVDEPVRRWVQRNRSGTLDDVSGALADGAEPLVLAGVSAGVLAAGVIAGDPGVRSAGGRLVASVGLAGVAGLAVKSIAGRSRPAEGAGAFGFHPFSGSHDSAGVPLRGSLPSGHVTAAFAFATSLADDLDGPVADALLYTLAAGTAWSRINDDRHWLSDVAVGAAVGVSSAKLASGRWRVFDLRPPGFLVTRTGAPALAWTVALPPLR